MKTFYDFYHQASKNTKLELVVVMKMNTRAPLVVLDLGHFIDLITKIHILVKQILTKF